MINIHDKLWAIKNPERDVEDSEFPLSYMTYVELKADGSNAQSFEKRMSTGENWAKGRNHHEDWNPEDHSLTFDNSPQDGFKIVGSVSRWSTDNKVIRVEDPRGFVVEIPTGNLTTLLKHCIVDKGVVKEQCVWGREGGNHLLLPINSDVYSEATSKIEKHDSRVSFSKLSVGDVVRFHVDDSEEYVYAGKAKAVWKIYEKTSIERNNSFGWRRLESDSKVEKMEIVDDKWNHTFFTLSERRYSTNKYKQSGKAIIERRGVNFPDTKSFDVDLPKRLTPEFLHSDYRDKTYYQCETDSFIWKEL